MGGPQEVPSSCSHLFLNLGRCIFPHPRARLAERTEERFLGWRVVFAPFCGELETGSQSDWQYGLGLTGGVFLSSLVFSQNSVTLPFSSLVTQDFLVQDRCPLGFAANLFHCFCTPPLGCLSSASRETPTSRAGP